MGASRAVLTATILTLVMAGGAHASAPVTVITDGSGDANATANQPVLKLNSPASYAALDVVDVSLATAGETLKVRFGLAGAPEQSGPPSIYTLNATIGTCAAKVIAVSGRADPREAGGFYGFLDFGACGAGLDNAGVTAADDGSGLVVTIPFATLRSHSLTMGPGTLLSALRADTSFGVYTVSSERPPAPASVLIDLTDVGTDYTVPTEE